MITSDFHIHTSFSTDGKASPEKMIEASIKRGLETICITDHYDLAEPYSEKFGRDNFVFDPVGYFKTLNSLREEYAGKIDVRIGVELGLLPHSEKFYKEFVNKYPFDFVIGSLHFVRGIDVATPEFFEGRSDEEAYRETFAEMLEDIKSTDDFDVLGHMDFVTRYGKNKSESYSYGRFSDEIDSILKTVVEKGKGLEMNMSGLKYGLSYCHPHSDILKRYRELGGEIITVGSDAHRPEHVGYYFEKAGKILEQCGFIYYTEFLNRKPYFHRISCEIS